MREPVPMPRFVDTYWAECIGLFLTLAVVIVGGAAILNWMWS